MSNMKDQIMLAAECPDVPMTKIDDMNMTNSLDPNFRYQVTAFTWQAVQDELRELRAHNKKLRPLIEKLAERLEASQRALEFYAQPQSIEPYLTEGKEKKFGRPGIKMGFYESSHLVLQANAAFLKGLAK